MSEKETTKNRQTVSLRGRLTEDVCRCSLNLSMVELEREMSLNIPSSLLVN